MAHDVLLTVSGRIPPDLQGQIERGERPLTDHVALARAFMLRPPILMADEPTGNLDSTNGAHVLELLLNMNQKEGTTLVLVTHDPQLASRAERRIHMRDGVIVSEENVDDEN